MEKNIADYAMFHTDPEIFPITQMENCFGLDHHA